MTEEDFWLSARHLLHFVGICGAGKTTLANMVAERCRRFGGRAIGTLDYDPHVPDNLCYSDRAFNRELDLLNIAARGQDPQVQAKILEHSLERIDSWRQSNYNLIVADRWYESYDYFQKSSVLQIEEAIQRSGLALRRVLLTVPENRINSRLSHTRDHRPDSWWKTGPSSLNEWSEEEIADQRRYQSFCQDSTRFDTTLSIDTDAMDWKRYENLIVGFLS